MTSNVHIFDAASQPATNYVDHNVDPPLFWAMADRHPLRCFDCGRVRWAKNMRVKVYYDDTRFFCHEGHDWDGRRRRFVTRKRPPRVPCSGCGSTKAKCDAVPAPAIKCCPDCDHPNTAKKEGDA